MNLIGYHERRIEAQAEMSDYLIVIGLILIFFDKIGRSGKGYLSDVLLDLSLIHTDTGIDELHRLLLGIHDDLDLILEIIGI